MKKVLGVLLLFFLMSIPRYVFAYDYFNYVDSNNRAKNYIKKGSYVNTHSKYIKYTEEPHFITEDEFNATKGENLISYLFDGVEYWTSSSNASGKHLIINFKGGLQSVSDESKYNSRDIEVVNSDVTVLGKGTYANPWTFDPMYEVKVKTNERYGYIIDGDAQLSIMSVYVTRGTEPKLYLSAKTGFMYITNDCNATYLNGELKIPAVRRNITCTVVFGTGQYEITLKDIKPGEDKVIYLKYRDNFYKDNGYKNTLASIEPPTKTGYKFKEYRDPESGVLIAGETGALNRVAANSVTKNLEINPTFEILPPEGVSVSASGTGEKVYNKDTITLTCSKTTSYSSDTTFNYQFGYSTSETGTITWDSTVNTTGSYTIAKDAFAGTRYYACKVSAAGLGLSTPEVTSENRVSVTYANPRIDFDATTNGGTISGTTPLYSKYGTSTLFTGRTNVVTTGSIPSVSKTGYGLEGWYTAASGGTKVIDKDGNLQASVSGWTNASNYWILTTLTNTSGTHKLYAHYTANLLTFSGQTLNNGSYGTAYTSNAFTAASNGTGSYTYTIKNADSSGATIDSASRKISIPATANAKTYNIVVTAKDNTSGVTADATMKVTINKVAATLSCSNKTYSGSAQTACSYSGCSGTTGTSGTNAGSYTATCTADSNHSDVSNVTWTMYKKTLTCPSSPSAKSYTGSSQNSGISCPTGSAAGGDTSKTNAGTYYHTCTPNDNHQFSGTCSVKWVINKVAATLSCSNKTYSGSAQTACSYSGCSSTTGTSGTNAGSYTATCTADSNHSAVSNVTWTMYKKTLTCPSSPSAKSYTGSSQNSGISCPTGSTAGGDTSKTNAGTYYQSCTANTNYQFSGTCSVKWVINKVAATLTCSDKSYTGSTVIGCTYDGCKSTKNTSGSVAKTYTASCTADDNHTDPADATWKIIAAHWYRTVDSKKVYYATLAEAINAASAGETVTAKDMHTDTSTVTVSKKIYIDLNNHIVTRDRTINISSSGYLLIKGTGDIRAEMNAPILTNAGKLTVWNINLHNSGTGANSYGISNSGTLTLGDNNVYNKPDIIGYKRAINSTGGSITIHSAVITQNQAVSASDSTTKTNDAIYAKDTTLTIGRSKVHKQYPRIIGKAHAINMSGSSSLTLTTGEITGEAYEAILSSASGAIKIGFSDKDAQNNPPTSDSPTIKGNSRGITSSGSGTINIYSGRVEGDTYSVLGTSSFSGKVILGKSGLGSTRPTLTSKVGVKSSSQYQKISGSCPGVEYVSLSG